MARWQEIEVAKGGDHLALFSLFFEPLPEILRRIRCSHGLIAIDQHDFLTQMYPWAGWIGFDYPGQARECREVDEHRHPFLDQTLCDGDPGRAGDVMEYPLRQIL